MKNVKKALQLVIATAVALVAMLVARSASAQDIREIEDAKSGKLWIVLPGTRNVTANEIVKRYDQVYRQRLEDIGELEPGTHLTREMIYRADRNSEKLIPVCLKTEGGVALRVGDRGVESVWRNCEFPNWVPVPGLQILIPTTLQFSYERTNGFAVAFRKCVKAGDCSMQKAVKLAESSGIVPETATPPGDPSKGGDKKPEDPSDEIAKSTIANVTLAVDRFIAQAERDIARAELKDAKNGADALMNKFWGLAVIALCVMIAVGIIAFGRGKKSGRKVERKIADQQSTNQYLLYQEQITDRDNRIGNLERKLEKALQAKPAPAAYPALAPITSGIAVAASVAAMVAVTTMGPALSPQPVDQMPEQRLSAELARTAPIPEAKPPGNGSNLAVASLGWTRDEWNAYDRQKRASNAGIPVVAPANDQNGQNGKNVTVVGDKPTTAPNGQSALFEARIESLTQEASGLRTENETLKGHVASLEQQRAADDASAARMGEELTLKEQELEAALAANSHVEGELVAASLSREQINAQFNGVRYAWFRIRHAADPMSRIGYSEGESALAAMLRNEAPLPIGDAKAELQAALADIIDGGVTSEDVGIHLKEWYGPFEVDDDITTVSGSSAPPSSGPLTFSLGDVGLVDVFQKVAVVKRTAEADNSPPTRGRTDKPPAPLPVKQADPTTEPSVSGVHLSPRSGKTKPPPPPPVAQQVSSSALAAGDDDPDDANGQRVTLANTSNAKIS